MAVSESLPTASATGDDVSLYQLKWVEWKGGYAPIITQVRKEEGGRRGGEGKKEGRIGGEEEREEGSSRNGGMDGRKRVGKTGERREGESCTLAYCER